MFFVNAKIVGDSQPLEVVVADIKNLARLISFLEDDKKIDQFKIATSQGPVKDLYRDFGWGDYQKFCVEFNWT